MARPKKDSNGRINVGLWVDAKLWHYHAYMHQLMKGDDLFDPVKLTIRSQVVEDALLYDCKRMIREAWERVEILKSEGKKLEARELRLALIRMGSIPTPGMRGGKRRKLMSYKPLEGADKLL